MSDAGTTAGRITGVRLVRWVESNSCLARRLYNADPPLTVESDIDVRGTRYEAPLYLVRSLLDKDALVIEAAASPRQDRPDLTQYRLSEAFVAAVETHTDPLDDRGGWCADADCARTHIVWPDDAEGPRCPCGAELREEAVRNGGGGDA